MFRDALRNQTHSTTSDRHDKTSLNTNILSPGRETMMKIGYKPQFMELWNTSQITSPVHTTTFIKVQF